MLITFNFTRIALVMRRWFEITRQGVAPQPSQ